MTDHLVAFWNLENLFAPEDFDGRIPWIADRVASDLVGWSEEVFSRKIDQLASIIVQMKGGSGPDILGVCEVENAFVLGRLSARLNELMLGRDYTFVHAESERDRRGIDTAFLFDSAMYSVDPELIFSHFVIRRTGTRDILQATFKTTMGNDLIVMANHWPSRSGGAVESAGFRQTAGETLGYWHGRIREVCGPDCAVVAIGDLNDDPFDGSVVFNANATRELGDVQRARSARFYNCSWSYLTTTATDKDGNERTLDGTLYFRGNGNVFDQILLSPALVQSSGPLIADVATAGIEAIPEMISTRVSEGPIRFGLPRGDISNVNLDGYSDHFPVSIVVREEDTATV